jgi:hypothetical protein
MRNNISPEQPSGGSFREERATVGTSTANPDGAREQHGWATRQVIVGIVTVM